MSALKILTWFFVMDVVHGFFVMDVVCKMLLTLLTECFGVPFCARGEYLSLLTLERGGWREKLRLSMSPAPVLGAQAWL